MRKNFSDVAFYPQPVLVIGTYDENGTPNAMNVGWGGMCGSKYVNINISVIEFQENSSCAPVTLIGAAVQQDNTPASIVRSTLDALNRSRAGRNMNEIGG